MKKILKILGAVLLVAVFVVVTLVAYLTIDEYRVEFYSRNPPRFGR